MPDGSLNTRDQLLVQWLRDAHAKESELEVALEQHIGLTEKMAYKKRLRSHLTETRDHRRRIDARIKQLGGELGEGPLPTSVSAVAGKTVAALKGQLGAVQAAVSDSDRSETHLRNLQEELREEHVEIVLYSRIEAFALEVGDTDSAKLAASIRRDEVRMAKYLEAELPRLVRDLVRAQVPLELRRKRRTTSRRTRTGAASTTRSSARGKARTSASRRATSRQTVTTTR